MRKKELPREFLEAKSVLEKLVQAGFEAFFVGGSVRDFLRGTPIHDVDIATSAYPEEVKELFRRTVDVGIEHGTVLVLCGGNSYEVTTFRTDGEYQDYRRPDSVKFVRSLEEDLKRRDFTMNALAMNVTGEITDLFGGQADLERKLIRAVGNPVERFQEDALRMMRAFRFSSQLDFAIEAETFQAIVEQVALLEKISVERIQVEFLKLMKGAFRARGLRAFLETEAFVHVPVLCAQYREKLQRLLMFSSQVSLRTSSQVWALLAYVLDFAAEEFQQFLRQWKESRAVMKQSQQILRQLRVRETEFWTKEALYQTGFETALLTEELVQLIHGTGERKRVEEEFQQLTIQSRSEIVVRGGELQKEFSRPPGKWLGQVIAEVERAIVNGQLANEVSAILTFVGQMEAFES